MPGKTEKAFATLSLILFSNALVPKLFHGHLSVPGILERYLPGHSGHMTIVIFGTLYFILFIHLFIDRSRFEWFLRLLERHWFLFLPAVWASLSTFWSLDAALTLRRSAALFCTTGFGIYLGGRFDIAGQLRVLSNAILFIAVLSLFFVYLTPWGIHVNEIQGSGIYSGFWMGAFVHKNALSTIMCLGVIAFFCMFGMQRVRPRGRLPLIGNLWQCLPLFLLIVLIIGSRGMTSILGLICAVVGYFLYRSFTTKPLLKEALVLFIVVFMVIGTVIFAVHAKELLSFLGKDLTLTGRVPLWKVLSTFMLERPWLGYGFTAFMSDKSPILHIIWNAVGWEQFNAHNGWIQLHLDMGLIGFLVVVGILINFIYHSYYFVLRNPDGLSNFWPLLFITFVLVVNFSTYLLFSQHSLSWILIASTLVAMRQKQAYGKDHSHDAECLDIPGPSSRPI